MIDEHPAIVARKDQIQAARYTALSGKRMTVDFAQKLTRDWHMGRFCNDCLIEDVEMDAD